MSVREDQELTHVKVKAGIYLVICKRVDLQVIVVTEIEAVLHFTFFKLSLLLSSQLPLLFLAVVANKSLQSKPKENCHFSSQYHL